MADQSSSKTGVISKYSVKRTESAFQKTIYLSALAIVILVAAIFLSLLFYSLPSLHAFGLSFLFSKTWDPVAKTFGVLPFLVGTLLSSFLALLICLPFSLAISIFIGEYFKEGKISAFLKKRQLAIYHEPARNR